jgi:C4-dicarboxylate-specific signal transduction histidine kinase
LADQPVLVMGDPIQFSQIVLNVFRNAIDALIQVEKRQFTVVCSRRGDRAVIEVRDKGPGFTPETLQQIGMPFFTTKSNGLGMGLSISRTIAVQHGGMLLFSNVDAEYGGGAQVTLNLPFLIRPLNTLPAETIEGVVASSLKKRERDIGRVFRH